MSNIRYITKGKVIDHDDNDREYLLAGVKANKNVILGGQGYCIEIRTYPDMPTKYLLTLVTEREYNSSVAICNQSVIAAVLKNFTYLGSEICDG